MAMTLEQVRDMLWDEANNNKKYGRFDFQAMVDAIDAHLSAQAKVRLPDDVEEVTTSLGDDAAYLRMQNDGESEIADNMERAANMIESLVNRLSIVQADEAHDAARLSQGAQGEAAVCSICNGEGLVPTGALEGKRRCKACAVSENFTYGHCIEKNKPGGCQKHNLQCGYPDCDRRPAERAAVTDGLPEAQKVKRLKAVAEGLRRIQEFESARYLDEYAGMLTAAPQPPEGARVVDGWQPIETAPRNATPILIYIPSHDRKPVCEAWWATEYEGGPGHWQTPIGPNGRGYIILPEAPTHWMPLPAAPTLAGKDTSHD